MPRTTRSTYSASERISVQSSASPSAAPRCRHFAGALMLAVVTAVNVVVTGDDPNRAALLDGHRAALLAAITASGLRRAGEPAVALPGATPARVHADAEAA